MSKFYGTVHGAAKTVASRRAHKSIVTYAASWEGAIRSEVYENSRGVICARVSAEPWQGGGGRSTLLYDGPLSGCFEPLWSGKAA